MDYALAGTVILSGLVIVFIALILLTFIAWLMGKVMHREKAMEPVKAAPAAAVAPPAARAVPPVQPSAAPEDGLTDEVAAVIAAAVAAALGGRAHVIRSVRRADAPRRAARTAWSLAGMQQNTRPF